MTDQDREEAKRFAIAAQVDPLTLTPERQRKIKQFFPHGTLPGTTEEEAPTPPVIETPDEDLLAEITGLWGGGQEDLEACITQVHPDLSKALIQAAIEEVRQRKERETSLFVSVEISHWDENNGGQATYSYKNDPKTGIYALKRTIYPAGGRSPQERVDSITPFFIAAVTRHENPLDVKENLFSILFRHAENPRARLPYEEVPLEAITADLATNQAGVRDLTKVKAAISALVDKFETDGKVVTKSSIPATGFFTNEKERVFFNTARVFPVSLPEYDRRKTRSALEDLEEVLKFYAVGGDPNKEGSCDHALICLYFIIQAPLGFIRKQAGHENKVLLLHGVPHAGKTLLEKVGAAIWGIPEPAGVIGAAKLTAPQIATHMSATTLPLAFDEVRTLLSSPVLADLMKNSTTGTLVKERILSKQGFRKQQFFAYASLILSCNFLPPLHIGISERVIAVEFTARHKKSKETATDFDRFFSKARNRLPAIGAALRNLYITRWEVVQNLITQADQVKAGYELLGLLFDQEGVPRPAWLQEVTVPHALEETDPVQIVMDFLKEDLFRILRQYPRGKDPINGGLENIPTEWSGRLDFIKERNLLPPYLTNISARNLVINADIFQAMVKTGREVPGGLPGLKDSINLLPQQVNKIGEPSSYPSAKGGSNRKTIAVDREVFYLYCEAPVSYQEEILPDA